MQAGVAWEVATISVAVIATDAGTTPVGMAMTLAYEHAPGQYSTRASGVGISQEGEAMTLLLSAQQLAPQEGVH